MSGWEVKSYRDEDYGDANHFSGGKLEFFHLEQILNYFWYFDAQEIFPQGLAERKKFEKYTRDGHNNGGGEVDIDKCHKNLFAEIFIEEVNSKEEAAGNQWKLFGFLHTDDGLVLIKFFAEIDQIVILVLAESSGEKAAHIDDWAGIEQQLGEGG